MKRVLHKELNESSLTQNTFIILGSAIGVLIFTIFDYYNSRELWQSFLILRSVFFLFGILYAYLYRKLNINKVLLLHIYYFLAIALLTYLVYQIENLRAFMNLSLNIAMVGCYFPAIAINWEWKNQIIAGIYVNGIYFLSGIILVNWEIGDILIYGGTYLIGSSVIAIALAYARWYMAYKNISMEKELVARNIQLEQMHQELMRLSITDKLTGLYNRVKVDQEIERLTANMKDTLAIILIDVDHFKTVNDKYGHLKGDEVLMQISNILMENTREDNIVGRWGGEEFIVICQNLNNESVQIVAEKLRNEISTYKFEEVGQVTASFGVAIYDNEKDNRISLLKKADNALYKAKEHGRNRVVYF